MKALFLTNEYPPNVYAGLACTSSISARTRETDAIEGGVSGSELEKKSYRTGIESTTLSSPVPDARPVFGATGVAPISHGSIDADIVHATRGTAMSAGSGENKLRTAARHQGAFAEPFAWKREQLGGGSTSRFG